MIAAFICMNVEESPDSRKQETPRKWGPERAGGRFGDTRAELTARESNRDEPPLF